MVVKKMNNKVLYICSEYCAGMLPYATSIVNTMKSDKTYALCVSGSNGDYKKVIEGEIGHIFHVENPTTKIGRIIFRIFPIKTVLLILNICKKNNINTIHFITQDTIFFLFSWVFLAKFKIFYTVHDVEFHDIKIKNRLHFLSSHIFFYIPIKVYQKIFSNLVSNSLTQYNELKIRFPDKDTFYHPFPSLVTNNIRFGYDRVPELFGIDDYILFFGRIERYKGIDFLYETYINNTELQSRKLVLAGSGNLYFDRNVSKENGNVIFVNRYIADSEINDLFSSASIVVYPYHTATQSGVVSIALFFNKPFIVSDVPFFTEIVMPDVTGTIFEKMNEEALLKAFKKNLNVTYVSEICERQKNAYDQIYSKDSLKKQIGMIYE
jgi:glycosyltransferase involved in cell wall biosynthesis